jgi:hypothetical protein
MVVGGNVDPQNSRPDVPDYIRDFYRTHQGTIDRCINRVFGQKADGTPDPAATIMERQTIKNAPEISYEMSQFQLQGNTGVADTLATFGIPSKLGHGTVYIANDIPVTAHEIVSAVFHELGNILSAKISFKLTGRADPKAYGDPTGIAYETAHGTVLDKDTGARLEQCLRREGAFGPSH